MANEMRLGLVAGGGKLPIYVAHAAGARLVTTIALDGFAKASDYSAAQVLSLGQFGHMVKALKKAKATHVCFAGIVKRPDFSQVKPDLKGMRHLPGAIRAAGQGDDALLRHILGLFEKEGLIVVSPQEICEDLLLGEGALGTIGLSKVFRDDALKACEIAREIGRLDIGQGAVVSQGVVLAVEAQEGTDAMLKRIADLPPAIRPKDQGVLAKLIKPSQDDRVDLPTLGPETVRLAAEAGLAGIVAEEGRAFVIDRRDVIRLADELGIFIVGIPKA
ncbi:LpxI family protein [Litorimonas sp. RW-G-Af-16]|uniref:LpxI family protein n=1 Tax=Litorimonas sp. RW-G-Af-16 TaxID=3241168 RepID=UPI00390CCF4C